MSKRASEYDYSPSLEVGSGVNNGTDNQEAGGNAFRSRCVCPSILFLPGVRYTDIHAQATRWF